MNAFHRWLAESENVVPADTDVWKWVSIYPLGDVLVSLQWNDCLLLWKILKCGAHFKGNHVKICK